METATFVSRSPKAQSISVKTPSWRLITLQHALAAGALLHVVTAARAEPSAASEDDLINPDRPGVADGSNVVVPNRFQVETGVQREFRQAGLSHSTTTFLPTLLRLGIAKDLEARVEGNAYIWMKSKDAVEGTTRNEGAAPTSLGIKYHIIDGAGIARPSVGAILRVFPPSGSGDFRSTHTVGDFRLAADWDFAPQWSLNPNVGIAAMEGSDKRTYMAGLFAATLNYNPSKSLNIFFDTGVQSPEQRNGKTSVIIDFGIAYIVGQNLQLDFSVGSGVAGATSPRAFFSAGVSRRF